MKRAMQKRVMHWRAALRLAAVQGACVLALGAAHAAPVVAHFDSGLEGWAAAGNGGGAAQWQPQGYLSIADASDGWAYFAAPAAFRQPMQAGATLHFSLRSVADAALPVSSPVRVALVGAGLTLVAESVLPTAQWTAYDFTLGPASSQFRVLASAAEPFDQAARSPTAAQWDAVLGALVSLYISADYSAANAQRGSFERADLDDVVLDATPRAGVPEPGSVELSVLALAALALARRRYQPARSCASSASGCAAPTVCARCSRAAA